VADPNLTIKFRCENCGQKFSVHKNNAGKKGRCHKCKNIIVVPKARTQSPPVNQNNHVNNKADSNTPDLSAILQNNKNQEPTIDDTDTSISNTEYEQESKEGDVEESTASSRLPWFADIFLYPISISGLINLVILSFLPRMLPPLGHLDYWIHLSPSLAIIVVLIGYLLYCLSDYIRDSTGGSRRVPEIEISMDILFNAWELIWPILSTFVCIVACVGPLLAYIIITKQTDIIFWLLVTYSVLCLPMVLMAVVLFDSLRALNPVLIIASMFNVFLPYCVLVLIFFAVCGLIAVILTIMPQDLSVSYILGTVCIYLSMVMSHVFGRFCYHYRERLNWEV
jgi:DNA-directed RNA polymerase subunit M/transcription elongation factor TFIIS